MVGLCEFLLNPIVGRVSGAYGRRLFTLVGCTYVTVGNLAIATNPFATVPLPLGGRIPLLLVNRVISNTMMTIAGSVTTQTALADIQSGDGLAIALGKLNSMFGLGTVIGPLIGANLLARTGDPRKCYYVRAMLAVIHMIHN